MSLRLNRFLIFVVAVLTLTSCKTNQVFISVLVPAPVTVPGNAKAAGIINRGVPDMNAKSANNVHVVVSGSSLAMLKEGSEECVRGLKDALVEHKRFDDVKVLNGVKLQSAGPGIFPSPASWDELSAICRANNVEVIFALELFDTELKVNPSSPPDLSNPTKAVGSVLTTDINFTTTVKSGWRIYDPANKVIADEYSLYQTFSFTGNAINAAATADVLIGRKETVKKTANDLGRRYSDRIIPYWLRVTRDYYVKGNEFFEKATRMARAGSWDKAGELWQSQSVNEKSKIAGRACYNMAIINEINGDLDEAINWAKKSYEDYNNKLALRYLRILRNRKAENERLERQQ